LSGLVGCEKFCIAGTTLVSFSTNQHFLFTMSNHEELLILKKIAEGTSSVTGKDFLKELPSDCILSVVPITPKPLPNRKFKFITMSLTDC
jgi:hypothetical protein